MRKSKANSSQAPTLHISGLDLCVRHLEERPKDSEQIFYFILIENMYMLTLVLGHLEVRRLVLLLMDNIKDNVESEVSAFRIQDDQLAFIFDSIPAKSFIEIDALIRKTTREFGTKSLLNKNFHIAANMCYFTIKNETPEEILDKAFSTVMNPRENAIFSANDEQAELQKKSQTEMQLANEINSALSSESLKFAYQPIIETKTGKISHYECLLRIADKDGKLESAGSFIPIAEKMGFIDSIDIKTLGMAIDALNEYEDVHLALNISNLTIGNKQWIKTFFEKITPSCASRLIVEITETAAAYNLTETAYFIDTIQEAGVSVALDDFGSGYTSFRQIKALSFDMIKIDGSLIKDLQNNRHNQLLIRSLVSFISGLGLKTVAEHVNSGSDAKLLMEYGVDYMQGNYFGKPVKTIK